MDTLGLKEMGKFLWEDRENAKKNLVFHFGVGRQASSFQIGYVKVWPAVFWPQKQPQKAGKLILIATRGLSATRDYQIFNLPAFWGCFWPENGRSHFKSFSLLVKLQMNEVKYYYLIQKER